LPITTNIFESQVKYPIYMATR